MNTYQVVIGGEVVMTFRADFAQASSGIVLCDPGCEPFSTPFQVADARHRPVEAARILNAWSRSQGGEYWSRGTSGIVLRTFRGVRS